MRSAASASGSNAFNTVFFVGFDEPGGTYDHVPPGPVPPPHPGSPPGQLGFAFDRSGYRVPAVVVSPWVPPGTVCTDEYRHTSLLATLREAWNLGEPFTARDAAAPSFARSSASRRRATRDLARCRPAAMPPFQAEQVEAMRALGTLGRHLCHGLYEHARRDKDLPDPPDSDPKMSPTLAIEFCRAPGLPALPEGWCRIPQLSERHENTGAIAETAHWDPLRPRQQHRTCRWGACRKEHPSADNAGRSTDGNSRGGRRPIRNEQNRAK